jgi:hypothetical protein
MKCVECDSEAGRMLGLCKAHYSNYLVDKRGWARKYDDFGKPLSCVSDGCRRSAAVNGLCRPHYQMSANGGPALRKPCPIPGCEKSIFESQAMCKRHGRFMWRYGLTVERCIEMHKPENRICGNPLCRSRENLHLDHDHSCCDFKNAQREYKGSCGKCVRGWLCHTCNVALGLLNDSIPRLRGLITYLENAKPASEA